MFTHSTIAIVCNAPIENISSLKESVSSYPALIAVDGGIKHCYALGLTPDLIVGDFDSADPKLLEHYNQIPKKQYPKDKDKTDLEIALELVYRPEIEEITVFGALGERTDHTLANLILLSRYPGNVFLQTNNERMFVINKQVQITTYPGQLISLIPLNGPVEGIHTEDLKWELKNSTLDKQFIGISNEALTHQAKVSVKKGDLLCCLNT